MVETCNAEWEGGKVSWGREAGMRNTRWPTPHPVLRIVTLVLATVLIGCQDGSGEPPEALELPELPVNPGYLRAAHPNGGPPDIGAALSGWTRQPEWRPSFPLLI